MNEIPSYYEPGRDYGEIDPTYYSDDLDFPQERQMTAPPASYPGQPYPPMPYPVQPYPAHSYPPAHPYQTAYPAHPYPPRPYPPRPPYPPGRPPYWYGSGTAAPSPMPRFF